MTKSLPTVYIGALVVLIAILAVGLVASRVGGSVIRTAAVQDSSIDLLTTSPATRGVPITVRLDTQEVQTGDVDVFFRDASGELLVTASASVTSGSVRAVLPCEGSDAGTLVVREKKSGKTLGSQAISLLPPGRDCALGG